MSDVSNHNAENAARHELIGLLGGSILPSIDDASVDRRKHTLSSSEIFAKACEYRTRFPIPVDQRKLDQIQLIWIAVLTAVQFAPDNGGDMAADSVVESLLGLPREIQKQLMSDILELKNESFHLRYESALVRNPDANVLLNMATPIDNVVSLQPQHCDRVKIQLSRRSVVAAVAASILMGVAVWLMTKRPIQIRDHQEMAADSSNIRSHLRLGYPVVEIPQTEVLGPQSTSPTIHTGDAYQEDVVRKLMHESPEIPYGILFLLHGGNVTVVAVRSQEDLTLPENFWDRPRVGTGGGYETCLLIRSAHKCPQLSGEAGNPLLRGLSLELDADIEAEEMRSAIDRVFETFHDCGLAQIDVWRCFHDHAPRTQ